MKTRTQRASTARLPRTFEELVRLHTPRPITDDLDLRNTEAVVERLAVLPRLSRDQSDYLEVLSTLIEKYDAERYPIDSGGLTPLDRLTFLVSQTGMSASDLGRLLGDRTLGPKILAGDRDLSKAHIVKLARHFRVNPGHFLGA